jgi:hypothetical protein
MENENENENLRLGWFELWGLRLKWFPLRAKHCILELDKRFFEIENPLMIVCRRCEPESFERNGNTQRGRSLLRVQS